MRTVVLVLLILAPAGALAYHYGPGQSLLALDNADADVRCAPKHLERDEYAQAIAAYTAALERIPATQTDVIRRVRLERAKAHLQNSGLPEAYDELTALKDECEAAGASPAPEFAQDLRRTLAEAQYYMTWLQRLEGEPREAWDPDIEASRQNYKLLADAARAAGDHAEALRLEGDLESAIRLARLDISELQALPLPKQCCSCCSGKCKGKCNGKGRNPNQAQERRGRPETPSSGVSAR